MADDDATDAMEVENTTQTSAVENAVAADAAAAESADANVDADDADDADADNAGNDDAAEKDDGEEEEADDGAEKEGDAEEKEADDEENGDDPAEQVPESAKSSQDEDGASSEAKSGEKRPIEETKSDDEPLPTLPLKRARTAYFIFTDEVRSEVQKKHKGEGAAAVSKAMGQLWSALEPSQKEVYEKQSAAERARVARDTQRLKDAGMWPESGKADGEGVDEDAITLPVARIRKICKLDPDVKGISKESMLLITKATEMFCTKLGKECVTMAAMQNRRKLLPEDVVQVCSVKERFMFLKADISDLKKSQQDELAQKEKENEEAKKLAGAKTAEESGSKTLDSYFGKVRN